jgi:hypothetical protein
VLLEHIAVSRLYAADACPHEKLKDEPSQASQTDKGDLGSAQGQLLGKAQPMYIANIGQGQEAFLQSQELHLANSEAMRCGERAASPARDGIEAIELDLLPVQLKGDLMALCYGQA